MEFKWPISNLLVSPGLPGNPRDYMTPVSPNPLKWLLCLTHPAAQSPGIHYSSGSQSSQCCDPLIWFPVVWWPPTMKLFSLLLHICILVTVMNRLMGSRCERAIRQLPRRLTQRLRTCRQFKEPASSPENQLMNNSHQNRHHALSHHSADDYGVPTVLGYTKRSINMLSTAA